MRLIYLFIKDCAKFRDAELNFDSNDRFHFDDGKLLYQRNNVLEPNFFCTSHESSSVASVSAIIGKNGSGKTTIAYLMSRLFRLGSQWPEYICICEIENVFVCFHSTKNIPNDTQIQQRLGAKWEFRTKNLYRDNEGAPFDVVYYTPFFHPNDVWDSDNKLYNNNHLHDLSALSVFRRANEHGGFTSPDGNEGQPLAKNSIEAAIKAYKDYLNVARIRFMSAYAVKPDRKKIDFPLPLRMEIKPNLELFVQHEKISRWYTDHCTNTELASEFNSLQWYTRKCADTLRDVLLAFTIMLAKQFANDSLDDGKQRELLDMISLCKDDREPKDIVRILTIGHGDCEFRHIDVSYWHDVDVEQLIAVCSLWMELSIRGESIKFGFQVHLSDSDVKSKLLDLVESHRRLCGADDCLAFDPSKLSSGECAYLNYFSLLYQQFVIKERDFKHRHILLMLDELETTQHPDFQRNIVYNTIWFLNNFAKQFKFHVIFASHSPILLSDIPIGNVVFLKTGIDAQKVDVCPPEDIIKSGVDFQNTFAANIFDLYALSFFLDKGTVGTFATDKIRAAIRTLRRANSAEKNRSCAHEVINLIGDRMLSMLTDATLEKKSTDNIMSNVTERAKL